MLYEILKQLSECFQVTSACWAWIGLAPCLPCKIPSWSHASHSIDRALHAMFFYRMTHAYTVNTEIGESVSCSLDRQSGSDVKISTQV